MPSSVAVTADCRGTVASTDKKTGLSWGRLLYVFGVCSRGNMLSGTYLPEIQRYSNIPPSIRNSFYIN
jgi:hypothetical protein